MVTKYDDDEQPIVNAQTQTSSEPKIVNGKTEVTLFHREDAPLDETRVKVLFELTGEESTQGNRFAVDLVTVLDISGSMNHGGRLANLKIAMQFLIQKLGANDRLSLVTFSNVANKLCPLRLLTNDAPEELNKMVSGLTARGGTDIAAGLEEALKVLQGRRLKTGRLGAIMLLTDGIRSDNTRDPTDIPITQLPVYTFGLGTSYNEEELTRIAKKSKGGTFSMTDINNPKTSNLSVAFSQCLGGLLSVAVEDLTLTIAKVDSQIKEIYAGNYFPQLTDEFAGSVIISFGDLYSKEIRKVIVDVLLPKVDSEQGTDALTFSYSYKNAAGKTYDALPITISIERSENPIGVESPEVIVEDARLKTADKMKEARILADVKQFKEAKFKLDEAKDMLNNVNVDKTKYPEIEMLKEEVAQLFALMEPGTYERAGRAFALASELSHALQRFASRGDAEKLRTFAIADLDTYLTQVKKHEEDKMKPVGLPAVTPTGEKKPDIPDPLVALAEPLSQHLEEAIKSLRAIQDLLNKSRAAP